MTIGWIGDFAGGHKEALVSSFFPALKALPFKVRLTLIGVHAKSEFDFLNDYFSSFMNVELDIPGDIDWQNEEDIQNRISKFDIGIATLLNTELHRSKSAFKLKQYLNNGVPVLSSSIPENNCFVNGKNGFLCDTPDDFKNRIIEIKEMSNSDYNNLSETARKSISKFNLTNYSENLLSFFSESNP